MANDTSMITRELAALRELEVISERKERQCLAYIEKNRDEVQGWIDTMGVTAAADFVRDMA
ncbi:MULTISPECIES: hypothetical protein [unclassified Cupriavidus]|uniref:hypothetical protein n=1 Tax=unclassified Cupriavidus TaxID=2640874 RepID=UPI00313AF87D